MTKSEKQVLDTMLATIAGLTAQVTALTAQVAANSPAELANQGLTADGKKAWPPGFLEAKAAKRAAQIAAAKAAV